MARNTLTCDEHIGGEMLSAWRDGLLPDDEMRHIAVHATTCPACRERLAGFDEVARALHRQVELEPDERVLYGVRRQIASGHRSRWLGQPHARLWSGLGALGSVAALLLLFVYVLITGPGSQLPRLAATATTSARVTTTVTAQTGIFSIADPAIARQLSFAFVRNNDVWESYHGAQPRQITHLSLSGQQLSWRLSWTPDQSKILAWAVSDLQPNQPAYAWSITTDDNNVTPLPSTLAQACGGGLTCFWLTDRYIVHFDIARIGAHAQYLKLFDLQTGRDISTALDDEKVTEVEVRGSALYYTPYTFSSGPDTSPGMIWRFDVRTDTITRVFTVPGPLISQGLPAGTWDLSQNAHELVAWFGTGVTVHCPVSACHTYYQDTSGTTAAILTSQQSMDRLTISPDGEHAASTVAANAATIQQQASDYSIVQQMLPSGTVQSTALPQTLGAQYSVLGWTADSTSILVQQAQVDRQENTPPAALYAVTAGRYDAAHLVETLPSGNALTFAPTDG